MSLDNQENMVCLLADYIIERTEEKFYLRMGVFHGEPRIVEISDSMKSLRDYLKEQSNEYITDHEFCGYVSEFLTAIYERQNEYHRNVYMRNDGSLEITSEAEFNRLKYIRRLPQLAL